MESIKVEVDNNDKIIISIPIEYLLITQFYRLDLPFRITNKDRMIKWLKQYLLEYKSQDEFEENTLTDFDIFLNRAYEIAYEQCETWLEGIVPE